MLGLRIWTVLNTAGDSFRTVPLTLAFRLIKNVFVCYSRTIIKSVTKSEDTSQLSGFVK